MADFVFNQALGRIAQKVQAGATLRVLLLKAADNDSTHKDVNTVAALLATNATEADFTNYTRRTLSNVSAAVSDGNDNVRVDADDLLYSAAGGATNNTVTDVVIYEQNNNDADHVPLVQLDAVFTTDGNDVTLQFHSEGFWGSS